MRLGFVRATTAIFMARMSTTVVAMATPAGFRNPHNLPVKTCVVCNRPFTWRKKWEAVWDDVQTCSQRCNGERKKANRIARRAADAQGGLLSDASDGESSSATVAAVAVAAPRQQQQQQLVRKVGTLVAELSLDAKLPMAQAVAAANQEMGIEDAYGPLEEQVKELWRQLGLPDYVEDEEATASEKPLDDDSKAGRKAAKKEMKAKRRARREGDDSGGQKACTLCSKSVDLLIRCQITSGKEWSLVCGRCWKLPEVAGGVPDGDGSNPHYRYGGLWKNLARAV